MSSHTDLADEFGVGMAKFADKLSRSLRQSVF
jgi:hypothetical protein